MRVCWAVTLLVLVPPSPASCGTCTGTSVVPRVLALAHRHLRKSPSVRQPFAEISGSISFSPLVFPFPETVPPNFVCHFKGSLHRRPRLTKRWTAMQPTTEGRNGLTPTPLLLGPWLWAASRSPVWAI